jgi:hypothetical protein
LLAACAEPAELDVDEVEQAAACSNKFYCGPNTPKLGILSFFELDMTGASPAPTTGVQLESFEDGAGATLKLDVAGFHLRGIRPNGAIVQGNAPAPWGLLNAKLTIKRGTLKFVVTINSVTTNQHFYEGAGIAVPAAFPSYGMTFVEVGVAGTKPKNLCNVPHNDTIMFPVAPYEVLISRGNRYNPSTGEIYATGPATGSWFNVACTGDAISKVEVIGYNEVVDAAGLSSDQPQRTAAVHAIRAGYCGDGVAYTQSGTWIDIANAGGWLTQSSVLDATNIEAIWNEDGAVCLTHQRVPAAVVGCKIDACTAAQIADPFAYGELVTLIP